MQENEQLYRVFIYDENMIELFQVHFWVRSYLLSFITFLFFWQPFFGQMMEQRKLHIRMYREVTGSIKGALASKTFPRVLRNEQFLRVIAGRRSFNESLLCRRAWACGRFSDFVYD